MPLCVLGVHQLRFYLVFGSRAPAVLAREGHRYLEFAVPAVVLLAALGLGWYAGCLALANAGRQRRRPTPPPGVRTWLACALLLFALYCAQELLEGFFAPGHPAGIAGVLGHGGWTAAPVSLLIGAALALALRVAGRLLATAHRRPQPLWASAASESAPRYRAARTADWRLDPAAGVAAGRAPPADLVSALI